MNEESLMIIIMLIQSLLAILGSIIFFMVKRLTSSLDKFSAEDAALRTLIYAHREDTLVRFNNLSVDIFTAIDRRGHRAEKNKEGS